MAKSGEIQVRRNLIANIFQADAASDYTVDTLLDRLLELPEKHRFWSRSEAPQKKSQRNPRAASSSGKDPSGKPRQKKPVIKGGLDVTSLVRLVQRDLEVLEGQGLVEAFVRKDGKHVVVTATDRKKQASGASAVGAGQRVFWRAGAYMEDEVALDSVAGAVALETICRDLAWLVPEKLRDELLDARDRARLRMQAMRSTSPVRRWLAALRPESPSPQFERPMFDDDVRDVIERAIMERKKVRLQVADRAFEASVSQFIVKLPDRPIVEVWDHDNGELYPGGPRGPWCSRLRLETIRHAELLPDDADLSAARAEASEPIEKRKTVQVFEFRASPKQIVNWAGTWLFDQIDVLGEEPDGWFVCRYADKGDPAGFSNYLCNLGAAVEVLRPARLRASLAQHFQAAAAMYQDVQDIPVETQQDRVDDETLAAWAGTPRLVSPEHVPFTGDDLARLARSSAWQQDPEVVEGLCRLFCVEDPAGVCTPANPHSATEYLSEVERLYRFLPSLRTEQALATAMRDVVLQRFSSDEPGEETVGFDGWEAMAGIAWLELTGYRVRLRGMTP